MQFHETNKKLSDALSETATKLPPEGITLRQLFEELGEQGLLIFCGVLTIPNLLPVQLPGVSTVFGLLILLIGLGVATNRLPYLPERFMKRNLDSKELGNVLQRGAKLCANLDRYVRPRLFAFTDNALINRLNGFMILFAAALLMVPFPAIPLTNTLPAFAILFLVIGMLQRDGAFILVGYLLIAATIVWFSVIFIGAIAAGQGLSQLFRGA